VQWTINEGDGRRLDLIGAVDAMSWLSTKLCVDKRPCDDSDECKQDCHVSVSGKDGESTVNEKKSMEEIDR